ncbi:Ribosomal silencing factor RsfS [bioreactor metagenome]|uniref:Ribosomal silencing factor RsfS n=1 Tax=bioreactor metagenome TaxID=1076179 RepID=A0A645G479_9ZZZZ
MGGEKINLSPNVKEEIIIDSKEQLQIAVKAADSKRAEDILALDVREVSLLADYFMICSANSERQMNAITEEIIDKEEENNYEVKRIEGKEGGKWILIDLGDLIVHVFHAPEREFYNLEKLWSDAPLVNISEWLD